MKYNFKGNFGLMEFTVDKDGNASGTYQKKGILSGVFKNQKFSGTWENKGLEGIAAFTISDGILEGNWKKGKEPGPMKSKWYGEQILDSSSSNLERDNKPPFQNERIIDEVKDKVDHLKEAINKLYNDNDDDSRDSLFNEAKALVINEQKCSTSLIQDKLKLGSNRAKRIKEELEDAGIIQLGGDGIYIVVDRYLLVIEKFEDNKELLELDEGVVNQYLWSLYLSDGNVHKCYEMIQHYEQKFKSNRWLKLKGHCYSNFKWYDYALEAYEKSNSLSYLERTQKVFKDYLDLIEKERWEMAIDYFEKNLSLSVSENNLDIAFKYCNALYRSSESNEIKALKKLKEYIEANPEYKPFLDLAGSIANFLGKYEEDIDMLADATAYYKKAGNKEGILLVKESIQKVKLVKKQKVAEEKAEKARQAANMKQLEAERRALEKDLAKEEAALEQLKKHKFKTSRGITFCQFCGKDSSWSSYDCEGRQHGHNYVLMKVDGSFTPICNKCGSNSSFSEYSCS